MVAPREPAPEGKTMDRDHPSNDKEIERLLKEAYHVPPPNPDFVNSLGQNLSQQLGATNAARAADKRAQRWPWLLIPAAAAAIGLVVVVVALRRPPPTGSPNMGAHTKPAPFNVPWDPPPKIDPEKFYEKYAKYFEPEAVRRLADELDKDLDVDTLHLVRISSRDGALGWLFIDKTGKVVLAAPYALVAEFTEGLAVVATKVDEKTRHLGGFGFIDRTAKIAIPAEYEAATSFREGFAGVQKGGRWGFVNRRGEIVIEPRYLRVEEFRDGMARVWLDHDTTEFIDAKGRVRFRDGRWTDNFSEGLIHGHLTMPDGSQERGYLDRDFKLVIRFDHRGKGLYPARCEEFHEGRAAVEIGSNTWGFIDRDGSLVIPPVYKAVRNFSEGLAAVSTNPGVYGPWSYIDRSGETVLEPRFLSAGSFHEGLAGVFLSSEDEKAPAEKAPSGPLRGKWGFIDKTGRVVIPGRFYSITAFRHGLARVSENPYHVGFIDKTGAYVFQIQEPIPEHLSPPKREERSEARKK
jgi:hypothetical protein